jgi:hypothetical protein
MLEDALLDLTNRCNIVIDPFLGSGSTLSAADKTGRARRGVELEPHYVDVILRRYEAATGNPAFLIETGVAFRHWRCAGQVKQRRSRPDQEHAPSAVINPWMRRRRQAWMPVPWSSEARIPARPNLISYATG